MTILCATDVSPASNAEARWIVTNISVLEGPSAAEAILAASLRLDVGVVALASHCRSGVKRAVLGSVAEQVARHSTRPVLIVHARDPWQPGPPRWKVL